ncbi:MAG: hypothetical protein K0R51_2299 [Cytophagaceae bacterium]|jgi:hypothetical protein|nr:hypothetical protein [Cytophagaceae bacterium]
MKILQALSLLFLVVLFSFAFANQEMIEKYFESHQLAADASEVVFQTTDNNIVVKENANKPNFMQVEKINQHELPAQARIGYLLSRGF